MWGYHFIYSLIGKPKKTSTQEEYLEIEKKKAELMSEILIELRRMRRAMENAVHFAPVFEEGICNLDTENI